VLKNHAIAFALAACHQSIGNQRFPSVIGNLDKSQSDFRRCSRISDSRHAKHLPTYDWWFLTNQEVYKSDITYTSTMKQRIAFIGAGKMASALISCIYNKNLAKSIIASDKSNNNLTKIKKQFKTLKNQRFLGHKQNRDFAVQKIQRIFSHQKSKGFFSVKTTTSNNEAVKKSDIVFICVKPQDIDDVLYEMRNVVKNQLIVSIAAGIKLKYLESKLKNKRIIRVMPNINCLAGEMAAGFSANKYATKQDIQNVLKLLNSAGIAFQLREDLLDAVTAISGSGPAFFAYFIGAFAEAGIKSGLPRDVAFKLAAQTALGTGKLLLENNLPPEELIRMVASKKGTTIAGLNVLKKHNAKNILIKTINAAVKRSRELGR